MKSVRLIPAPAPAIQLLADFICSPVSMRAAPFFATVRDLHSRIDLSPAAVSERLTRLTGGKAAFGDPCDDDEELVMPWEQPIYTVDRGLAVVDVRGAFVKGYDPFTCWWYGLMSTDRLQAANAELAARNDVEGILYRFNTPGGVSIGMPETALQMVGLGGRRLTVGFTSDYACSNGQRLLSACDLCTATGSAVVGAIGTYLALYDCSEMLAQMGIKLELFRDGNLKGIGVWGKEITADEKKFLAESIADNGAIFKNFVSARRPNVTAETMQGQWFTGEQGKANGLIDEVVPDENAVVTELRAQLGQKDRSLVSVL